MGLALSGRPHSHASIPSPEPVPGTAPLMWRPWPARAARPSCATRRRSRGVPKADTWPARPGCSARGRWRGLVARNQSLTCRAQLINPRGVAFVPGTAWPARPLVARAASCARRVASKPGQAPQALRRPPQGRRLLSTLSWPYMPVNSAYAQTRPRPVSRPRPRQ